MPTYIKIITFIENYIGQKLYNTHCIPLDNNKEFVKGVSDLIYYCEKHVPSFLSAEIVHGKDGQIKPTK